MSPHFSPLAHAYSNYRLCRMEVPGDAKQMFHNERTSQKIGLAGLSNPPPGQLSARLSPRDPDF